MRWSTQVILACVVIAAMCVLIWLSDRGLLWQ